MRREEMLSRAKWAGRLEERERIARELHDTLLQGAQGLILEFQSVANRLPLLHPIRKQIETALNQADDFLEEARGRVQDLRSISGIAEFGTAINREGELLAGRMGVRWKFSAQGDLRSVKQLVAAELYAIAIEAVRNAFAHSRGTIVCAALVFSDCSLGVRISDDGCGFDAARNTPQGDACHFGLQGMRERAEHLGARLIVRSSVSHGTEIACAVPAATAYITAVPRRFFFLRSCGNTGRGGAPLDLGAENAG
jgi:signal transduction histidine kinase